MKIAYLILAHHKPQQLHRLAAKLPGDVWIHVDRKSDISPFLTDLPNVHLIADRIDVHWGCFNTVQATIALMKHALQNGADRLVLLSGVDYPVRPVHEFHTFLSKHSRNEFIEVKRLKTDWSKAQYRYLYAYTNSQKWNRWIRKFGKITKVLVPQIQLPNGFDMYGGSQWWNLTKCAAQYCVNFAEQPSEMLSIFQRMLLSDEHFFQTVLMNSPHRNRVINDNLRAIIFEGAHPRIYQTSDLDFLLNSGAFFARKFDSNIDSTVLDGLDCQLKAAA